MDMGKVVCVFISISVFKGPKQSTEKFFLPYQTFFFNISYFLVLQNLTLVPLQSHGFNSEILLQAMFNYILTK